MAALFFPLPPPASADAGARVGVAMGPQHAQLRDDLVLPYRTSGAGAALLFTYAHETARAEHAAALGFGGAYATNRFEQRSIFLQPTGRYEHTRLVGETRRGLWLGGLIRGTNALQYHLDWDDAHLYWFTAYDVGPVARVRRAVGGGTVGATLAVPLVAIVSRPPEHRFNKQDALKSVGFLLGRSHEDPAFATAPTYLGAEARLTYARPWGSRARWAATYAIDVRRHEKPRLVALLGQSLSFEVQRAF